MQLGFIGVGNIGTPMCRHLVEAGHTILAYDVDGSNLARMVSLGAQGAVSPKAVANVPDRDPLAQLPGQRSVL